jgi:hypothetical protein
MSMSCRKEGAVLSEKQQPQRNATIFVRQEKWLHKIYCLSVHLKGDTEIYQDSDNMVKGERMGNFPIWSPFILYTSIDLRYTLVGPALSGSVGCSIYFSIGKSLYQFLNPEKSDILGYYTIYTYT